MPDSLTEFLFPAHGVRGAIAEINTGIEEMFAWRRYSGDLLGLLGQAVIAMPLLASHTRFDGRINLQFQGKSGLKLLVAQIDRQLQIRGMAKTEQNTAGSFTELMDDGLLALVLEPEKGAQNYQAVVEVRGDTLGAALQGYFAQSEQLPTLVRLASAPMRLAGLLLQGLPERGRGFDESWMHLSALFVTLGAEELASTEPMTVLRRLFHAEELRIFEPRPLKLACACSHGSISAMLLSLGQPELEAALAEQGKLEVTCEFCGRVYDFPPDEVRGLFAASAAEPAGTRH